MTSTNEASPEAAAGTNLKKVQIGNFTVRVLFDAKKRNSFCWKHFGNLVLIKENKKISVLNEQVFCSVCLAEAKSVKDTVLFGSSKIKSYSKSVSTGNLMRHLRDEHNIREESIASAGTIKKFFSTSRPSTSRQTTAVLERKGNDKWLLARDLALWFCRSLMPFNSVSDDGMQDFFAKYNIIESKEDLPSRYTISGAALDDIYESILSHVKNTIQLDASLYAAITFDLWSDQYRRQNYITFTYHYLTEDFQLKCYTLLTCLITGEKTGQKICEMIFDIKNDFALHDKTLLAVTDAGANVKKAVDLASLEGHLCLGHGLHNMVNVDGIHSVPEIKALILKSKKIVKALRFRLPELEKEADKERKNMINALEKSSDDLEHDENDPIIEDNEVIDEMHEFFGEKEDLSRPIPSIKTSTPTRWHSVLTMLESLNHACNRHADNILLGKIGREELKLNSFDWKLMTDVINFLKKFKDAVEMLSSQKTTILNIALVFRSEIKDTLQSLADDESLIMLAMKRNMMNKLDHRFPVTKVIVAATLLDCRFQGIREVDDYLESTNHTRVSFLSGYVKEVVKASPHLAEAEPETAAGMPGSSDKVSSMLIKLSEKHSASGRGQVVGDPIDQECWKYFATSKPQDLQDGDLLKYWLIKKTAFPWLAALARSILGVPATSTPSERVFSTAGLVLSAKRSRLSHNRVNKIIFVHDNYTDCKNLIS